ncbi:MAG: hypothetical protein FWG83_04965 [Oscillospiraceae bacterium]|nr:hypothetical protein [Oscillospiraceae bacterium]
MREREEEQLTLMEELLAEGVEAVATLKEKENEKEEISEEINVLELIQSEIQEEEQETIQLVPKTFLGLVKELKQHRQLLLSLFALVIAIIALAVAIGNSGRNFDLPEEGGTANEMLGNLIRNELAAGIPDDVNLREVNVQVIIHGRDGKHYSRIRDIRDTDRVSAKIVFFPQENIHDFAQDCRKVLDVMKEQNVVYDEISFASQNAFTNISAELSGRFTIDITVDELISITYYHGRVEVIEDIQDIT